MRAAGAVRVAAAVLAVAGRALDLLLRQTLLVFVAAAAQQPQIQTAAAQQPQIRTAAAKQPQIRTAVAVFRLLQVSVAAVPEGGTVNPADFGGWLKSHTQEIQSHLA